MIIQAAYAGPPFAQAPCSACSRNQLPQPIDSGTSPLAGFSYTSVGTMIMAGLAVAAIGLTLYSFNGGSKKPLSGRRSRRSRR